MYGKHLAEYNFEEIVIKSFPKKQCHFSMLSYFTRGAIESAFVGLPTFNFDDNDSIMFLDNDIQFSFPNNFFKETENKTFLAYSKDETEHNAYSFVKLDDQNEFITEIVEKQKISDFFCCGIYGFSRVSLFQKYARFCIDNSTTTELFMSSIFSLLINDKNPVNAFWFQGPIYHIGTAHELEKAYPFITKPCMRVCFDLDNTLVTYPTIPGRYETVKPIPKMIDLAKHMKQEGHTIIIHTARRMQTHQNNVGKVIADIARITIDTLERCAIPYDELIFGKPIADV